MVQATTLVQVASEKRMLANESGFSSEIMVNPAFVRVLFNSEGTW